MLVESEINYQICCQAGIPDFERLRSEFCKIIETWASPRELLDPSWPNVFPGMGGWENLTIDWATHWTAHKVVCMLRFPKLIREISGRNSWNPAGCAIKVPPRRLQLPSQQLDSRARGCGLDAILKPQGNWIYQDRIINTQSGNGTLLWAAISSLVLTSFGGGVCTMVINGVY